MNLPRDIHFLIFELLDLRGIIAWMDSCSLHRRYGKQWLAKYLTSSTKRKYYARANGQIVHLFKLTPVLKFETLSIVSPIQLIITTFSLTVYRSLLGRNVLNLWLFYGNKSSHLENKDHQRSELNDSNVVKNFLQDQITKLEIDERGMQCYYLELFVGKHSMHLDEIYVARSSVNKITISDPIVEIITSLSHLFNRK